MSGKIYRATWRLAAVFLSQSAGSQPIPAIAGKNGWIFSGVEKIEPAEAPHSNLSIELIRRFNEVLTRSGVTMVLAMVPIKSRIDAGHLPAELRLSPYRTGY